MRTLKFLVIVMAVLIIAAVAVIVVTLFNRASGPSYRVGQPIPELPLPLAPENMAAGSRIVAMTASGDRLAVHVRDGAGADQIILVDLRAGVPISRLTLPPP